MYLQRCKLIGMDGVRLHRLGKRLIDLSRDVTTSAGASSLTHGEVAVLEDVLKNPGSPVSDIQSRTGFVQSHVSASVARLRDQGLLTTEPDPADRRRTLVRLTPRAKGAILARAAHPATEALAAALPDPAKARHAEALLDELAELLLP